LTSTVQAAPTILGFKLTADRVWTWGIKSGLSVVDQGFASGAGFLLSFLLARWLDSESFGAFAVAFATLLFLSGFHNVLLLEPMSVIGPAHYAGREAAYFVAQLKVHKLLAGMLAAALLLTALLMSLLGVTHGLVKATAASAFALPFFLMLWLVRRLAYMLQRPALAGFASAGYFVLIVCGLLLLHRYHGLSPATAFLLMGTAGLLCVVLPLRQLGLLKRADPSCSWTTVARENWKYGRWLVLSTALFSVAGQTQIYLTAALLGLGTAGVLRAMQIPSLVMTQIVIAVGLLILPSMSYEFGLGQLNRLRRKAILASLFVTLIALAYAAVLALLAGPIEHLLYGGKFTTHVHLIPILGLVPVCTGFAVGFSMAVRASQKPHFDLLANAVSAPVGLLTALIFIRLWGLQGASLSLVAGFAAYGLVFWLSFRKISSRVPGSRGFIPS
jgi:O-antigen/teichoic acid export membrane protein